LSNILSPPTFSDPLEIYTDGNEQYLTALLAYFRKDSIIYGRIIKHKKAGKLMWKTKQKILRNPDYRDIDTTVIENYNGILRERISRLVRKTKCFSKKRSTFEKHLDIFQAYNNVIKEYYGETPCMKEKLTDKKWCWNNIFMYH